MQIIKHSTHCMLNVTNQNTILPASTISQILQCILLYCFDSTLKENYLKPARRKSLAFTWLPYPCSVYIRINIFFWNAISLQNLKVNKMKLLTITKILKGEISSTQKHYFKCSIFQILLKYPSWKITKRRCPQLWNTTFHSTDHSKSQ